VTLPLLPQPKVLSLTDGAFALDADTMILMPAQADDRAYSAGRQLQENVFRSTCLTPPIAKAFAQPRSENVILLICGADQANSFDVAPLDIQAPVSVADQAYALTVTPSTIILYTDGPAGLFYAVQTLRQVIRLHGLKLPGLDIQDWPSLSYRGLMLDISRRKVPTLSTLKQVVAELAHFKLNVLQLYTEHTFQFPRHPKIGADCGSLSSQDILELDAVCRQHHIELMPNLQSFGHMRNTLLIPEYQHLAETDLLWTLSPAFEETYTLLDELYADMLPAFTSNTLNVDCDETYDLGKGASKSLAEEMGVGRVYLSHILRVRELAARHGRHIQMWGDILLHHPELIDDVPDDVTLLDWHYDPADEYPTVKTFAEAGRRFWVCPGVGSWNSVFPRLYGANVNIRNLTRDGVDAGAEGMLNTDWGDHGHYQPLGLSWYGYAFGAAQGWTGGTTSDEDFQAAFGPLFFDSEHDEVLAALHRLADTNQLPNVYRHNRSQTILALFDEPLVGDVLTGEERLPEETLKEMHALAKDAAATFDRLAPGHPRELVLREMASAARLTAYAACKVTLSLEIRQGLHDSDLDAGKIGEYILALKTLDIELEQLRAEFEALWFARARRSEIHVALGYYAGLRVRYRAAIEWLEQQRQSLLRGGEVDADLSTYDAGGYRTLWQNWPD
jgi:hexosaminidase